MAGNLLFSRRKSVLHAPPAAAVPKDYSSADTANASTETCPFLVGWRPTQPSAGLRRDLVAHEWPLAWRLLRSPYWSVRPSTCCDKNTPRNTATAPLGKTLPSSRPALNMCRKQITARPSGPVPSCAAEKPSSWLCLSSIPRPRPALPENTRFCVTRNIREASILSTHYHRLTAGPLASSSGISGPQMKSQVIRDE
jgi:hypothetical protein